MVFGTTGPSSQQTSWRHSSSQGEFDGGVNVPNSDAASSDLFAQVMRGGGTSGGTLLAGTMAGSQAAAGADLDAEASEVAAAVANGSTSGGVTAPGVGAPPWSGGSDLGFARSAAPCSSSATDPTTAAIDNSPYAKALAPSLQSFVANLPTDQQRAAELSLARPIAAAEMLAASETPAAIAAATAFINANPALMAAIATSGGGKNGDAITKEKAKAFVKSMEKQLSHAADMISVYHKNNPFADNQSLQLVSQAAVLLANQPITNAADQAKHGADGKAATTTTREGLQAIVNVNPGLSPTLKGAANTWSQRGMYALLDQGGLSGVKLATTKPDDRYDPNNIKDFVAKQAPTTGGQFASTISSAAALGAVDGIDTSNLNGDVFENPQHYSAAQKAAVLIQLQSIQTQVDAGSSLRKVDKTIAALQDRIGQLQADPAVVAYLNEGVPQNEAAIIASDPALAAAVQARYAQDIVTGVGLQSDIASVEANDANPKNRQESDAAAINDFSSEIALGKDLYGDVAVTLQQAIAGNPTVTRQLQDAYNVAFSQGGELQNALRSGADPGAALKNTQSDERVFEQALSPDFIQSQSSSFGSATAAAIVPVLLKSGSGSDVLAAMGNGPASVDEVAAGVASLNIGTPSGQAASPLSWNDRQAIISAFLQDLQNGTSLQDALAKYDPASASFNTRAVGALSTNPQLANAAHAMLESVAASALLNHAAAKSGSNGAAESALEKQKAEEAAGNLGYGLMGLGFALGGASIYVSRQTKKATAAKDDAKVGQLSNKANKLAIASEVVGVAGGSLTAALTLPYISELLKQGQKFDAAVAIGAGTRGIIQATTGSVDLGTALATGEKFTQGRLSRLAAQAAGRVVGTVAGVAVGEAVASSVAAAAGPVGWAIDGVLFVAFIATAIQHAVQKAHERKAFANAVNPTLEQYGIPTPH